MSTSNSKTAKEASLERHPANLPAVNPDAKPGVTSPEPSVDPMEQLVRDVAEATSVSLSEARLALERVAVETENKQPMPKQETSRLSTPQRLPANSGVPKHVQVGPHVYTIYTDAQRGLEIRAQGETDGKTCIGSSDHHNLSIWVDGTLAPSMLAETLLHEILHACCASTGGLDFTDDEEGSVKRLSPLLFGVLRENPMLMRYLLNVERY